MTDYIFITAEGYTYQPDSESMEPDIENAQVLGFARGRDHEDAFHTFLRDTSWVHDTSFCEVICMPLAGSFGTAEWFEILGNT